MPSKKHRPGEIIGTLLHPDTLRSHCRARLARYKVPAAIRVVDEVPRTAPCKADQQCLGRAPR